MKVIAVTADSAEREVIDLTNWLTREGFELKEPTEDNLDYFLGNMRLDSQPCLYVGGPFTGRLDYTDRCWKDDRNTAKIIQLRFDDEVVWEDKNYASDAEQN